MTFLIIYIIYYECHNLLNQIIFPDAQLIEPIELDGVRAAAIKLLPQDTPVVAGTPTQISGWGVFGTLAFTSGPLLKADVPIIDYDECSALFDGDLLPKEICAGTAQNLMDACNADEGGALVYDGTLVGIATWGNTCGVVGEPGRYTNAASYTDWIVQNSGLTPPARNA
jgi:Trypsin